MGIETLIFFHVVVKRRNNSSGIHRLQANNDVIEDSKLIEDHILEFYRNIYAESNSNGLNTGSMEEFIGSYILEIVYSEENIMLTKIPNYLKIKNEVFNLNGNNAPGPNGFGDVLSFFFIIGDVQQFFKQN